MDVLVNGAYDVNATDNGEPAQEFTHDRQLVEGECRKLRARIAARQASFVNQARTALQRCQHSEQGRTARGEHIAAVPGDLDSPTRYTKGG